MKYSIIKLGDVLNKVSIKSYRVNTDEWVTLHEWGALTLAAVVNSFAKSAPSDVVLNEMQYSMPKEIMLSYEWDGKEILIDFFNSTSDVCDEHFRIDTSSRLFADSVMIGYDLCMETNDAFLRDSKGFKTVEEYYENYYAKRILKDVLIEHFVEGGFEYNMCGHMYVLNENVVISSLSEELDCLPADNLRRVLTNYDLILSACAGKCTVGTFLATAAKSGYLKFKPYIKMDSNGNYSLVLKYNRFVHLFRGMYYQCSYTERGIGTYSSSGVRLDTIYRLFQNYELHETKLCKYLYYMNLIHCCREIDAFNDLLENDSALLDEFMRLSTKRLFRNYDIKYIDNIVNDVVSFMGYGTYRGRGPGFLDDPKEIYRIAMNDTSDYARVNIYDTHMVSIELWEQDSISEVLFTLPDVFDESVNVAGLADDWNMEVEEFGKMVTNAIYDSYEVRCALTAFALNFCGFVTNFLVTYPTMSRKDSKLRALNQLNVPEFKNLGVLYKSDK